jgi:hypothetical protein
LFLEKAKLDFSGNDLLRVTKPARLGPALDRVFLAAANSAFLRR